MFPVTGKVSLNHTVPNHIRSVGGLVLFIFHVYDILYFKEVIL